MSVFILTVYPRPQEGDDKPNTAILGIYSDHQMAKSAQSLVESALKLGDNYGAPTFEYHIEEWGLDGVGPIKSKT